MDNIIKTDPLHIQAYSIIKKFIMDGDFVPGERIIESKLANKLGISRGPIREAIRMLIQDGLIIQDDGFAKVYAPHELDIIEVFQCRESLENLAIQLAIHSFNEKDKEKMHTNIEKTKVLLQRDTPIQLSELDNEFHQIIINASKNKQLIQLMDVIKTKIVYIRNSILKNKDKNNHEPLIKHHEGIYKALLDEDIEQATNQMSIHIRATLEDMLNYLNKNKEGS